MYEAEREKGILDQETYDLIELYYERLSDNNMPIIYNLRHLRKILQIPRSKQNAYFGHEKSTLYKEFKIPKKSGEYRIIEAPLEELKIKQVWIKTHIIDKIPISKYAMGFKKNSSIYHNAIPHTNQELVLNIDIKDFFPSITYRDIYKIFSYMGYTNQVAHLLTKLCTNQNNVLPQGAPTSPGLSNIVLLKLDKRLSSLAHTAKCNYTRYADDITFSGDKKIKALLPLIFRIIEDEGFTVNKNKLRLRYANQRQEVTGLIVNKKVALPHKTRKEIENAIYFCQKYGVQEHMAHINCNKSFYKEHLYGIAYFCKMIEPEKGKLYLKELDKIEWLY